MFSGIAAREKGSGGSGAGPASERDFGQAHSPNVCSKVHNEIRIVKSGLTSRPPPFFPIQPSRSASPACSTLDTRPKVDGSRL